MIWCRVTTKAKNRNDGLPLFVVPFLLLASYPLLVKPLIVVTTICQGLTLLDCGGVIRIIMDPLMQFVKKLWPHSLTDHAIGFRKKSKRRRRVLKRKKMVLTKRREGDQEKTTKKLM